MKPKALTKGDTIAVVSPSSCAAGLAPRRFGAGLDALRALGFNVVAAPNATKTGRYTAGTAAERAADIYWAFSNKDVSAVISALGGFHSNQLLDLIDFELIRNNPKIFCGYSDITVLHYAIYTQTGLTTFYGPAVMTQFAEPFGIHPYTLEHFKRALMQPAAIGEIKPSHEWTDEVLNWFADLDLQRPKALKPNPGHRWLRAGRASGKLIGGCLTSMLHLRGTKYWPDFAGAVFFWELPESSADFTRGEPVSRADAHLTDLALSGVFDRISAMVVGRPRGYTPEETQQLEEVILERTARHAFPILSGFDIGHTDPIITMPIGVNAEIDSTARVFRITEPAVVSGA